MLKVNMGSSYRTIEVKDKSKETIIEELKDMTWFLGERSRIVLRYKKDWVEGMRSEISKMIDDLFTDKSLGL